MPHEEMPARLTDGDADALAELLDRLVSSGTQHITLETGPETKIRTVHSTDCSGRPGPCSVPNTGSVDFDE